MKYLFLLVLSLASAIGATSSIDDRLIAIKICWQSLGGVEIAECRPRKVIVKPYEPVFINTGLKASAEYKIFAEFLGDDIKITLALMRGELNCSQSVVIAKEVISIKSSQASVSLGSEILLVSAESYKSTPSSKSTMRKLPAAK